MSEIETDTHEETPSVMRVHKCRKTLASGEVVEYTYLRPSTALPANLKRARKQSHTKKELHDLIKQVKKDDLGKIADFLKSLISTQNTPQNSEFFEKEPTAQDV
jgi:hypothetical protein